MTRRQALNYLRSSGFSPEQVRQIEQGLREFDDDIRPAILPEPGNDLKTPLPREMEQRFLFLETLLQLASVAGDLYILQDMKHQPASDELAGKIAELRDLLKEVNEDFCFEC